MLVVLCFFELFNFVVYLQQTGQHVMRQNHRFELALDLIAVLTRQHVHLPLVHTQLTDVGLQVEDIRALHARVHDLRRHQVVGLLPAHNLRTPNM